MEDSDSKRGRWTVVVVVIAAAVLLVLLYVLSWGPAYGHMQHGRISDTVFDTFYYPLIALGEQVPWIKKLLNDYGGRWVTIRMGRMNPQFQIRHLLAAITVLGVEIGLVRGALVATRPIEGACFVGGLVAMTALGIWLLATWTWNKSNTAGG